MRSSVQQTVEQRTRRVKTTRNATEQAYFPCAPIQTKEGQAND